MRLVFWLLIAVFCFAGKVYGQKIPNFDFHTSIKSDSFNKNIIAFEDGSFATKEIIKNKKDEYEILISRYSECLELLWAHKIKARAISNQFIKYKSFLTQISEAENNNLILVYTNFDISSYPLKQEAIVVKFSYGGDILWFRKLNLNNQPDMQIQSLNCNYIKDDGYFISGSKDTLNSILIYLVSFYTKISKDGKFIYGHKFQDMWNSGGESKIHLSSNKEIILSNGAGIHKIDSTGKKLMSIHGNMFGVNTTFYHRIYLGTSDKNSNIYCAGELQLSNTITQRSSFLLKLDKSGKKIWAFSYADFLNTFPGKGFILKNLFIDQNDNVQLVFSARQEKTLFPTLIVTSDTAGNVLSAKYFKNICLTYLSWDYASAIDETIYNNNILSYKDIAQTSDSGFIFISGNQAGETQITKIDKSLTKQCYTIDSSISKLVSSAEVIVNTSNTTSGYNLLDTVISATGMNFKSVMGCSDNYSFADLGNDTVICDDKEYVLSSKQKASYKKLWSTGDTTQSIKIASSGKYWLTISSGYCTNTDTVTIIFREEIKSNISDQAICPYDSVLVKAPNVNAAKFYWIKPDKSIFRQHDIWAKDTGSYYLLLDGNGNCLNIDTFRLQHNNLPKSSAGPDTLLCYNQSYEMQGKGGITYKWIPAKYLSNDTIANPIAKAPNEQLYMLIVKNAYGCADTSQMWLKVKPKLEVKLTAQNQSVCFGEKVQLQAKASGGDSLHYMYKWQHTEVKEPVYQTTLHQSSWIKVTLEDDCSETAEDSIFITIKPTPIAAFYTNPKDTSIEGNKIAFINQSRYSTTYHWSFGNGKGSNSVNPSYIYTDTGKYFITLISQNTNGCSDTAYGQIYIGEKFRIFIPNAFSPDGDLVNDVFSVYGTGIKEYSYQIYNRWGQRIFTSIPAKQSWNGAVENRGELVQMDVYFYVLKVKDVENRTHYFNGTINVLK